VGLIPVTLRYILLTILLATTACSRAPVLTDADIRAAYRPQAGPLGVVTIKRTALPFPELEKELQKQKKFNEAKVVALVVKKALETSYNYYRIDPQKIGDRWGIVFFALVFYVFYTLWYGFGIMFMFEGWGLELGH